MNTKLFETLKERGYFYQFTDEEAVKKILNGPQATMYCGFDPTADSFHIGHCMPLFLAKYLQEAGHKIIIVLGGATAMIGDPSGRNDMRKMVEGDFVEKNRIGIESAISRFIKLDGDNPAIIVNNADWYRGYDYIDFMRDIGVHFNVNKMLACDAYSKRLENGGLTFFEMGYMLMQAYDFLYLNRNYGCSVEFGGSDQWANILAGAELSRKFANIEGNDEDSLQAFTNVLLMNSEGNKMGKTEKGALWVDKNKCSPYDFYQYFYNVDDRDVQRFLKILTYLPLEEIANIMAGDIRDAKHRLAYEVTKVVHGAVDAENAQNTAKSLFGGQQDLTNAPSFKIGSFGIGIVDVLVESGLCQTKSDARRMIEQNAISLNDEKITDFSKKIEKSDFVDGYALLKKGKKSFMKVEI